jgi:hypothetical protein
MAVTLLIVTIGMFVDKNHLILKERTHGSKKETAPNGAVDLAINGELPSSCGEA